MSASQSKENTPQAVKRTKQSQTAQRGGRKSQVAGATKRKSAVKELEDAEAGAQEPEAKKSRNGRRRKLVSDDPRYLVNDETQPQMLAGWELWGEEQEGADVPAVVYPPGYFKQQDKASGWALHQPIDGADDAYRAAVAHSMSNGHGHLGGAPRTNHVLLQNSTRMSSDGLPSVVFYPTDVAPYSSTTPDGDHFQPQHTNGYGAVHANDHTHSPFETRHDTPMVGNSGLESDYDMFSVSFNTSLATTSDQDHVGAIAHTGVDSSDTAAFESFNNSIATPGRHGQIIAAGHPSFDSGYGSGPGSFNNPADTMGAEAHNSFAAQPNFDGEYTLASGSVHDHIAAINAQVHASIANDSSFDSARGMFTNPALTTGTQDHTPLMNHPSFDIDYVTAGNTLVNGGHNPLAGWIDTMIAQGKRDNRRGVSHLLKHKTDATAGAQESFVTEMEEDFTDAFADRLHDETTRSDLN